MYGYDALGQKKTWGNTERTLPYQAWMQKELEPLKLTMPDEKAVVIVSLVLEDNAGKIVQRNFTTFIVEGNLAPEMKLLNGKTVKTLSIDAKNFSDAKWSKKQWNVMDGAKVNGAGAGYFEYKIKVPKDINLSTVSSASFIVEADRKSVV